MLRQSGSVHELKKAETKVLQGLDKMKHLCIVDK